MTTRIFTIWSLLFSQEITKRQQQLISIYWPADEHMPCFLFVTQPFDVAIAGPYKSYLKEQSLNIPSSLQLKLNLLCPTAQKKHILILSVLDAFKKAATSKNFEAAWAKTGFYEFNPEIAKICGI